MPRPEDVFSVGLGGIDHRHAYKNGNLEARRSSRRCDDVTDGWGSVTIDVSSGKKGHLQVEDGPQDRQGQAGDVACCGVNNRGVARGDKVISVTLDGRLIAINKATGDRQSARSPTRAR